MTKPDFMSDEQWAEQEAQERDERSADRAYFDMSHAVESYLAHPDVKEPWRDVMQVVRLFAYRHHMELLGRALYGQDVYDGIKAADQAVYVERHFPIGDEDPDIKAKSMARGG